MIKRTLISFVGFSLIALGLIFILLPGPAVIFIPLGLAILSTEYHWAKTWLRKSQRIMRTNAQKLDLWWLRFKSRNR
ncbi:PGPGW domain-containing protein [Thalassotalea insulae]|uniref:PGPGW domain-containing protein n=1 Tax=Thalassotalea insulae TaxID=2056778 RepID=UPI0024E127C4|nr:PGPGW domain-containing protein [Thalassotalea insulae]